MNDKVFEDITIGLSDEEKNDLEKMIKAFRAKQSATTETSVSGDADKQMLSMGSIWRCHTEIRYKNQIIALNSQPL